MRAGPAARAPGRRGDRRCRGRSSRAVAELGATANTVDPVFQVMPKSIASVRTASTGDPVFPIPTRSELAPGDVIWVDTGINLHGYASDFGATWIVGREPDAVERDQFARWRAVVDRTLAVVRAGRDRAPTSCAPPASIDGARPWLSYFYLAHGIGTDSAEMPFVGTDLGDEFDASLVLQPGMVLVFEPVIWDDGHAGPPVRGDRRGDRRRATGASPGRRRSTRRARDAARRVPRGDGGPTASTRSSSAAIVTCARSPVSAGSGWPARGSSRRPPSSCAAPRRCSYRP